MVKFSEKKSMLEKIRANVLKTENFFMFRLTSLNFGWTMPEPSTYEILWSPENS